MWRILVIGSICGCFAVPIFREGTTLLLYRNFETLQAVFSLPLSFRPVASGYQMHPVRPLGLPALVHLMFWGSIWGVILAGVIGFTRLPPLLAGFLFGALVCTAFGFAPHVGEQGLPFWSIIYLPNWARTALINAAWGWGAAGMMAAAGLLQRWHD
jgi:hypothetical protein